ncbi:MAG: thiamine-phosphate kinase, partial [Alphaproteobacteria bacterium]
MDEFGLIARFFAPLASADSGALGLTDDAAVLDLPPESRLVAATDALVAGVHFLADDPPGDIARKLMRVNLSDIAAMGAVPRAVLLAAVLPRGTSETWLEAFAGGLAADTKEFGAPLVGGDTVATDGPLTLALTALGTVD